MADPDRHLEDGHGRIHRALRLSITDRCNLRCRYCMPTQGMDWIAARDLLTGDEIVRLVGLMARLGVRRVRVTGGEPLVRPDAAELVARIARIEGIDDIALTTNGVLLERRLDGLIAAGLNRVNISLDSLDRERFTRITRRDDLSRVLAGIEAACRRPELAPVKVNAVIVHGVNEQDILPLATMARRLPVVMRFIEVMPLDAPRDWSRESVVSGQVVRDRIARRWPLEELPREDPAATGRRFAFADQPTAHIETVSSVTESFCAACDRLRLTADGALRTCLFSHRESDLRGPMRNGSGDGHLEQIIRLAVAGKGAGHAVSQADFRHPARPMSRIGG